MSLRDDPEERAEFAKWPRTVSPKSPSFEYLRREKAKGRTGLDYIGPFLHPRPEFYKHEFCFFILEAEVDAPDFFLKQENWLCLYEYRRRRKSSDSENDVAVVHARKRPRRGKETPFDENHPKWCNVDWAPPLSEDSDPMTEDGYP